MQHLDLNALSLFSAVAKHRNFRRAAIELGMPASTLSERLRAFEAGLGVRLFNRTTRSVSLTQAGQVFLAEVSQPVARIEAAVAAIGASESLLSGRLRINGPSPALEFRLAPIVAAFMDRHEQVRIELIADEALIDIVGAGFDAGVRYGENLVQDMIAVSLGRPQRMIVVGAPHYFAKQGRPASPRDLHTHRCFGNIFPKGNMLAWSFEMDGQEISFTPNGPFFSNSVALQLTAVLAGHGLAYLFEEHCEHLIRAGQLEVVLGAYCPSFPAPSLYYPERRLMPAILRAFIDFVVEQRQAVRALTVDLTG